MKAKTIPSVEAKPYMVTRLPYGDPIFKTKWEEARNVIRKDLIDLRDDARRFCDAAMDADVDGLFEQLQRLSPWDTRTQRVEGTVRGLIEVKYCAEIRKREEF